METIKIINYVIMVIFFACYAYQFFYIPVALLKKGKQPSSDGAPHRFAVLVAARNEEAVIGNLIDSRILRRAAHRLPPVRPSESSLGAGVFAGAALLRRQAAEGLLPRELFLL